EHIRSYALDETQQHHGCYSSRHTTPDGRSTAELVKFNLSLENVGRSIPKLKTIAKRQARLVIVRFSTWRLSPAQIDLGGYTGPGSSRSKIVITDDDQLVGPNSWASGRRSNFASRPQAILVIRCGDRVCLGR